MIALVLFVAIASVLIYVFASGQETTTLTLCGTGGGTLSNAVCSSGTVQLKTQTTSTVYTWHKGGYDGGGRGNTAAIDPLDAGYAALGGDIWGAHVSINYGNYWTPTNWGAQGNGDVYMRAAAFSLKSPGTVYWGVGTLKGGGGYFGTTPAGTNKLNKTNTGYGFGTALPQCSSCAYQAPASFTPRAVGKLILVDCDSPCSSNTEYIYALSAKGIVRSTDQGKTFTVLGATSVPYGAWKSIEKAPDGSLYAVDWGDRTTDTAVTNQTLYHITNPRGTASVSPVSAPSCGPMNDLATINGVLWLVCAKGVYTLSGSSWSAVDSGFFNQSGLTLSTVGGVGSTVYIGSGNIPAGSQEWVAKSTNGGGSFSWVTSSNHVSNLVQGTTRPFWLASTGMPGDNFGIEQLEVDPHNANFVMMATFRGAYSTTDGGNTWYASANGLDGTEVNAIKVGTGGQAWDNDTDWGSSTGKWNCVTTSDYYATVAGTNTGCPSGYTTSLSKGGYTVKWNSSLNAYDIVNSSGVSIADDYFRGSVDDPKDIEVTTDGYIYIANFSGGVIIGTPPGH